MIGARAPARAGSEPRTPHGPADATMAAMAQPEVLDVPTVQAWLDEAPYHQLVRLVVEEVDPAAGRFVLRLPFHADLARQAQGNQVHGGPIASVIDSAGTFAVAAVVGHGVPTMNLRIDYLRPAIDTDLVATATVRRSGRTIAICDIDLHDDAQRLVAVGRGTWGTSPG